jgi:hypothetical protein
MLVMTRRDELRIQIELVPTVVVSLPEAGR